MFDNLRASMPVLFHAADGLGLYQSCSAGVLYLPFFELGAHDGRGSP
jgi:hypothetical protein